MPLLQGKVRGFDFARMTVDFTMLNGTEQVTCGISAAAMDDLEGTDNVTAEQRITQFHRLRDRIETLASRKFCSNILEANSTVLVKSEDIR